jgi:hypothetical protein
MTKPNLTREYLLSEQFKHEFEAQIERVAARADEERRRRERRRIRLRRLSFGLLGR